MKAVYCDIECRRQESRCLKEHLNRRGTKEMEGNKLIDGNLDQGTGPHPSYGYSPR